MGDRESKKLSESNQPTMYRPQNCYDTAFYPLQSQTSQTNHHGAHDFIHKLLGITIINLQEYSIEPLELSFVSVISSCVLQGITNLQVYLVDSQELSFIFCEETETVGLLHFCLSFDIFLFWFYCKRLFMFFQARCPSLSCSHISSSNTAQNCPSYCAINCVDGLPCFIFSHC